MDLLLSGLYVVTRDFSAINDPKHLRDVVTVSDELGSELLAQNGHDSNYIWHPVREVIIEREPQRFLTLERVRRKWVAASTNVMSVRSWIIYETLRVGLADELLDVPASAIAEPAGTAAEPTGWRREQWMPALLP
ncbi:hypothetical protein C5E05_19135 [Pseudoclavibacter sp. AY1H1]|nr:hypothetical protein C5E05_19135 [Pseudoclavibacter sp. AY1H1]